ncbi:MAG: hypothetical protein KA764_09510 [Anaerolineales bacterium]|nr:hypothetical protein [Anaerolineales bacterium]
MPDDSQPVPPAPPGGAQLQAQGDLTIGGDVVGGDKITNITNLYTVAPGQAGAGLEALSDLLQNSAEARAAATAFQTDFLAAHQQLDLVGDYKLLHDLLHRLQFQCYNGVAQSAARFPADDTAGEQLSDAQLTLEGILAEARRVASHAKVSATDTAWLADLETVQGDLAAALDAGDAKPLAKVLWRLNRVLNQHPARINGSLIQAARALRLPALVSALTQLAGFLTELKLDAEKVGLFLVGVEAMGYLDAELTRQVSQHDQWQLIDQELRLLDSAVDRGDTAELELSWADLKAKAGLLYAGPATWAAGLRKDSAALDEALSAANPPKMKRAYRAYRRRAGERFFRVDVDLRELCEHLREVGAPLASVTRLIQ